MEDKMVKPTQGASNTSPKQGNQSACCQESTLQMSLPFWADLPARKFIKDNALKVPIINTLLSFHLGM